MRDLESIIVLVLLAFTSIPQRSHHSLTLRPGTLFVMPVGRSLFKITVIKVGFGVINQGHCCIHVFSVTDILGYNHVFVHIQLSLLQVTFRDLHVRDLAVEHVNKLKIKRERIK